MAKTHVVQSGYRAFTDSGIMVHRWVAQRKLGRKLRLGEVVHHKNRDKLDNRSSNLFVCRNQSQYEYLHRIDGDLYKKRYL